MRIRAGIDVRKDGAIVMLGSNEILLKSVTPTIGNQIDLSRIKNILSVYNRTSIHGVVEDVHAIFGASSKATFNFG